MMVTMGTMVAQELPSSSGPSPTPNNDPTVLGSDLEEFKRFEAFRNAQRDAIEKERSASTKEVFDEFQVFKQFRELRRQQTQAAPATQPVPNTVAPSPALSTPPSRTGSSGAVSAPGSSVPATSSPAPTKTAHRAIEDEAKPATSRSTILTEDAASSYSRYRFMHLMESTNHKVVTPATAPLSFGWDWVTTLGLSNVSYTSNNDIKALHGYAVGFGGRWVFPLATDTSLMVGPELRLVSGTTKGGEAAVFSYWSALSVKEVNQSMLALHLPIQIQQRFGRFNVAVGGYLSRPLFADETQVLFSGYKISNDLMGVIQGLLVGTTISVTYNDMGYQFGVYADLPQSNLLNNPTIKESRLTTYGLFIATRL